MALLELLVIAVGSFIVGKSSDAVVEKSVTLSNFFKISPFAIGFVLVATSTNLPELTLAVLSLVERGAGEISAANVFGANITNIALVLGLGALLYGFEAKQKSMNAARLALVVSVLVGGYVLLHGWLSGSQLGAYEAGALLLLFVWFAAASVFEKKEPQTLVFDTRLEHLPKEAKKEVKVGREEGAKALAVFLLAIAVLLGASYFVLESAIALAFEFGVAGGFVGATIVSLGTTLPELSVALQAFRKKHHGIGLGNAIGSVIVNSTLVLGTAALFGLALLPLPVFAVAVGFVASALLVFMLMGAMGKEFGRVKGAVLLVIYLLYLAAITYVELAA